MYALDDTIVAISTPVGQGGIGIVRLSGAEALAIVSGLFVGTGPAARRLASHRLHHGHVVDPATGRRVDEVLAAYMRAPRTYTRQDVVEIDCHGGAAALREVLGLCLAAGARPAQPGEFTLRAFLNGRIDLAQAEAVLDVINAETEASLRVAVEQLGGRLSGQVRAVRRRLVEALAHLEASIDFPEDEIPERDVGADLAAAAAALRDLVQEAERGIPYRQGIRVAIVGRPNVGKSSLLNALLRQDRAIVTPIPGTTRDTVEETISLRGIPVVLTDTAGLGESADAIERLGMERSRASMARADLVLLVVDGSCPPDDADRRLAADVAGRKAIVVANKADLPAADGHEAVLPGVPIVPISALTGAGIEALEERMAGAILSGPTTPGAEPLASNPRHRDLFRRALAHVEAAAAALADGFEADLVAIDVSEAATALGQVTGETAGEELLETIFGAYCIGK
jgi:tRNA modification GTPase